MINLMESMAHAALQFHVIKAKYKQIEDFN